MNEFAISARNITKAYDMGNSELAVLNDISLDIKKGEAVCIVGASGAGKSTLLHIIGLLDSANSGQVMIEGKSISELTDDELSGIRNSKMGFVFQFHHLLQEFTALENVMIPCRIAGMSAKESHDRAQFLLEQLGLSERVNHFPSEMSGGEMQRVAIARALVRKPSILFADEPTGNLDTQNSRKIQELFFQLKKDFDLTLVVVTHDREFASRFPKVMTIKDGSWVGTPGQR